MSIMENLWEWVLTAFLGLIGVLYNQQEKKIERLEVRVKEGESLFSAYRENAAGKYVSREEIKEDFAEIKEMLHRLGEKLDRKADK
ncbi:hypothetical protein ACFSC6_12340 [Rufibacter sediminis]|uniref:Uncharacterized protein n=1 Tax=Rufibacter sediminis TaxID=2762756 RepID=A0ABR6VTY7_9BACT|nr:hypothetical protein [Rufibacter sediminis]MBC3540672.1 hypothetical protein [Rufibacter sediminis]